MADTLTLLQLRTRAREHADMVGSSFVTDSELTGYVNSSYQEFYDLLTNSVEDYNITLFPFTISTGNTQALPTDHYKMRGLDDLTDAANPLPVRKYNFNERNDYTSQYGFLDRFSVVKYRIIGNSLYIVPADRAPRPYQLWYVPIATTLVGDSDTANGINGWLEYVAVDAAIKCLNKEESDTRVLYKAKKDLIDRIEAMRLNRDQSLPEKISRIRNSNRLRSAALYPYGE